MGIWDQLPLDLLKKIDEHLELYQDKVRSKCVCTHWDHAFPELPDLRHEQPPWLLLPFTSGSLCGLYHPFEKKLFMINLPEAGEKVFKGSGHGWVVAAQKNGAIYVVNPLTRVRFALPPRHKFTDVLNYRPKKVGAEYLFRSFCIESAPAYMQNAPPGAIDCEHARIYLINKIALSRAPTRGVGDFRAVAMYGETRRLAYCKLGDKKWTDMVKLKEPNSFIDITFCGGKLYAVNNDYELFVCDDIVSCPKLRKLRPGWEGFASSIFCTFDMHLINSLDGGIMLAIRRTQRKEHCSNCETLDFEIYKMDPTSSGWIRRESLAYDEILFMGLGTQLAIRGRSGNRIYFADLALNFKGQDKDDGIFRFEDKKFESLGYEFDPNMIFPSMTWVMPNPY